MKTLDHSEYDEEMQCIDAAYKATFLKHYIQTSVIFFAFGVVVYAAQWLLQ